MVTLKHSGYRAQTVYFNNCLHYVQAAA